MLSAVCLMGAVSTPLLAQENESDSPKNAQGESRAAQAQVFLNRANFSPGSIDGKPDGTRTRGALRAFQQANDLEVTGEINDKTMEALKTAAAVVSAFTDHTLTESDVAGPFGDDVAGDWKKMAQKEHLAYTSAEEKVAEKFHVSQGYLKELNPGKSISAGTSIRVPNVEPFETPAKGSSGDVSGPKNGQRIEVSASDKSLRVLGEDGQVLYYAPITPGSPATPLPDGSLKITGIAKNPDYKHVPGRIRGSDLEEEATIAPGPNSPVGVVWINLEKDGYGLHGTSDPDKIGYSESHGCVRMTNWDAMRVAGKVKYGMTVDFK